MDFQSGKALLFISHFLLKVHHLKILTGWIKTTKHHSSWLQMWAVSQFLEDGPDGPMN